VRVALIHALAHSVAPINAEFARAWPECERMNLLDDSLSADLARSAAGLDARMTGRFLALAGYALDAGADGILFTCSAFGPCIDAVAARWPAVPVLKPNEAMIDEAVHVATTARRGGRIGLVATFAPTLTPQPTSTHTPTPTGTSTPTSTPRPTWTPTPTLTPRPTLDLKTTEAITEACNEVLAGKLLDQFVVDVFQAGAGTSFNMNVNEVLANRALEILGKQKGDSRMSRL